MAGPSRPAPSTPAAATSSIFSRSLASTRRRRSARVRDEFRRTDPALPRLVFADIMVPHQGPAAQAAEVARRMLDAGVDAVGIHLQADARRADPTLIESHCSMTWPAPSSIESAAPRPCRSSAGSPSRRRKALPRRGCARS